MMASDLVLVFTGAFQTNKELFRSIPWNMRSRFVIAHRPNVDISPESVNLLFGSRPLMAVTESFCHHYPRFASGFALADSEREKQIDAARFFAVECGKGSKQPQTLVITVHAREDSLSLQCTFLPYYAGSSY